MKIKIKSEEELKKLGNFSCEDPICVGFRLKDGHIFYLMKDFMEQELQAEIDEEKMPNLFDGQCFIDKKTGRRFLEEWIETVTYDSLEKAEQLKNAPAGEVFSIPTNNYEKMKELEELSKPLVEWLNKNFDPHHIIVIQTNYVGVQQGVLGIPMEVKD